MMELPIFGACKGLAGADLRSIRAERERAAAPRGRGSFFMASGQMAALKDQLDS